MNVSAAKMLKITIVSILSVFCSVMGLHLPDKLIKCHLDDSKVDDCLNRAIYNGIQFIGSKGIPSLGLPSIDPMEAKEIHIIRDDFTHSYYEAKLYGYLKAKVSNSHLDLDEKSLTFTTLNDFTQKAYYNLTGRILQIPLTGNGGSTITTLGTTIVHKLKFNENSRNKKTYWNVEDYTMKMSITGATFDYENLFNGNQKLAETVHKILNENWKDVAAEQIKAVEKAYGVILKTLANMVFTRISIDDIFLK